MNESARDWLADNVTRHATQYDIIDKGYLFIFNNVLISFKQRQQMDQSNRENLAVNLKLVLIYSISRIPAQFSNPLKDALSWSRKSLLLWQRKIAKSSEKGAKERRVK